MEAPTLALSRLAFLLVSISFCLPSLTAAASSSSSSTKSGRTCTPTPISAAITNVTVANSPNNAIARGVAISVGSPAQDLAFMPYPWNNSLVYDTTNLCDALSTESKTSCITRRGGAYSAVASKTQKGGSSDATASDPSPFPATALYSDTWNLNADVALENFTFGVPNNDWGEQFYYPQNVIGLGPNSTFLSTLRAHDMIASRTYAFFWGQDGTAGQSNGSMVFGGYDSAKISGAATSNYTGTLNYTSCLWGIQVELTALGLFFHNGTKASLMYDADGDETASIMGCIDPGAPGLFDMSDYDQFAAFADFTNYSSFYTYVGTSGMRSTGLNFWDSLYLEDDTPYTGDIDVTFKDGPSVTVSNDQFVVPHVAMDDDSGLWYQNTSLSDLLINPVASDDYPLRMCRHFMTFVYVMVNLDAGTFTVWAANSQSNSEALVAVDEANNRVEDSSVCTTIPSPGDASDSSSSSATAGTASGASSSAALSGGAIGGIAVAAVAGAALVAAGVWFWIRRRQQKRAEAPLLAARAPGEGPPPVYADDPSHRASAYDEAAAKAEAGLPNTAELYSGTAVAPRSELGGEALTAAHHRSELGGTDVFRAELE